MNNFKFTLNKKVLGMLSIIIFVTAGCFFTLIYENNKYDIVAKIISVDEKLSYIHDINGKTEQIKNQSINAVIVNGDEKGRKIQLQNITSYSQINDLDLKVNDEVFVTAQNSSYKIVDFKRDKYLTYITVLFLLLILLIGGYKGVRSLFSIIINICLFFVLVEAFIYGFNFIIAAIVVSILFICLSIPVVCGVNKKALSAIVGTIITTIITMLIAILSMILNNWNGIHLEEMEFLLHSPQNIFMAEILIGTLGAVMDIAVSISSYIAERNDINPDLEKTELIKSGMEVGRDLMGTMANTLLLAFLSGSIPLILLLLKNNYSLSYIINTNLSLEFIRAVTGSIGVVLSIPISIYISVFIIKNSKAGGVR